MSDIIKGMNRELFRNARDWPSHGNNRPLTWEDWNLAVSYRLHEKFALAHNTYLSARKTDKDVHGIDLGPTCFAITLWLTDVVTIFRTGHVILNTGGFHTAITTDRMTRFSPFRIRQRKGILYVEVDGEWHSLEKRLLISIKPDREDGRRSVQVDDGFGELRMNGRMTPFRIWKSLLPDDAPLPSFEYLMREGN